MVDPIRPPGGPPGVPSSRPPRPAPSGPASFAEVLRRRIEAAPPPEAPRETRIREFVAQTLGTEAGEIRRIEAYDILCADEGLYEVQTPRGDCRVILSRSGSLSLVERP